MKINLRDYADINHNHDVHANIFSTCLIVLLFCMFYKPAFTVTMILFCLFVLGTRTICGQFSIKKVLKEQKGMVVLFSAILLAACGTAHLDNVEVALNMIYYTLPFFMLTYASKVANIKKGILAGLVIVVVAGTVCVTYEWLIMNVNRPFGLLRHPNNCALCMAMIMPLFMYYAYKCKSSFLKLCNIAMIGLCFFSFFLVKSRGVNIAMVACITLLSTIYLYKKNRNVGIILALGVPCLLYIYNNELLAFLHRGYDGERLLLYRASIKMWLDYPIFGTGFADWRNLYNGPYYPVGAKEYLIHSHNTYLHMLSAAGVVGLLGYLYFLHSFVIKCISNIKDGYCYALVGLSAFIVFMLHSFVDSSFSIKYVQRFFWLMFFIYQYSEMKSVE